jgi:hypothetical protein
MTEIILVYNKLQNRFTNNHKAFWTTFFVCIRCKLRYIKFVELHNGTDFEIQREQIFCALEMFKTSCIFNSIQ